MSAGQPQIRPAATPAAIHMSVLPKRKAAFALGHIRRRIIAAQAHGAGRQRQTAKAMTAMGTTHQTIAGTKTRGTKRKRA
jgi:hypothetical protein